MKNILWKSSTRGISTQYLASGTVENNLTTTRNPSITTGSLKGTEVTATESTTQKQGSLSTELSKPTQGSVQGSLFHKPSTQGQWGLTSVKPTNRKVEVASKEITRDHVIQSSGVLKPASRGIIGLPLKYIIIVSGSFTIVVIGIMCLVCKLCKKRYTTR